VNTAHNHNRKYHIRAAAAFAAAVIFCISLPLASYADVTTDAPSISSSTTSGTGGSVIIAPPGTGGTTTGSSSGSSSSDDSEIIIGDNPLIEGGSAGGSGTTAGTTTGNSGSTVGGAPGSSDATTNGTTAPAAGSSDTTTGQAPETAAASTTAAPAATAAETAAAAAAIAAAATAANTTAAAGSVYANSAVTRINLDFSLITPTHAKGALNVARASVQLKNGSWQNFDYKDNVHFAFYKMKESRVDSTGLTWYIATVKARRFGDTYTDDGEMKTELWLNSSDCTIRNTIDISTTNAKRIAIVKAALSTLGKQYVYGGNGPDAFDCSGLVQYVCKEAGITVPRTSNQLLQLDGQITAAELRPGDIMVRAGHCGIYIGNGIFVHASDSSVGVVAEYLSVYNLSNKFTNYVNVVGD